MTLKSREVKKKFENVRNSLTSKSQSRLESSKNVADTVIFAEKDDRTHVFVKSATHLQSTYHLHWSAEFVQLWRRWCGTRHCQDIQHRRVPVTPTLYKDLSVLRRTTVDHPICSGPTFKHTNSSTKAYSIFMHDVAYTTWQIMSYLNLQTAVTRSCHSNVDKKTFARQLPYILYTAFETKHEQIHERLRGISSRGHAEYNKQDIWERETDNIETEET